MLHLLAVLVVTAPTGRVEAVWSGCDQFAQAVRDNAMAAELRDPGRAAGSTRRAVFLHPQNERPATLTWELSLPPAGPEDRVVFRAWPAMSDGVQPDQHPMDGVGLGLTIDGERLFRVLLEQPGWQPACVDLSRFSGRTVKLALVTDCGPASNASYDWAMFGDPQVVVLRGNALGADLHAPVVAGACLVDLTDVQPGAAVRLQPVSAAGEPAGPSIRQTAANGLSYLDFDVAGDPSATGVRLQVDRAVVRSARLGSHQAAVRLLSVLPSQGVLFAGQDLEVRVRVENTGRAPVMPDDQLTIRLREPAASQQVLPRLGAGETRTVAFRRAAQQPGRLSLAADAVWQPDGTSQALPPVTAAVPIWPPPPGLPATVPAQAEAVEVNSAWLLQDRALRVAVLGSGHGPVLISAAVDGTWRPVAAAGDLGAFTIDGLTTPFGRGTVTRDGAAGLRLTSEAGAAQGELRLTLGPEPGLLRWSAAVTFVAAGQLQHLRGPELLVGDGSTGAAKRQALFPGLEYLKDDEPSSSTRDFAPPLHNRLQPDPYKVTIPLMAVQTANAVVGLLWSPNQEWQRDQTLPAAIFASPNHVSAQDNHLLCVSVPGGREHLVENEPSQTKPADVAAGETVRLSQQLFVRPQGHVTDAVDAWCQVHGGVPQPDPAPRDAAAQHSLSRHGFLQTVWDAEARKSRHCVGWDNTNAPQYATLLAFDALLTGSAEARDRARLIVETTLAEEGEAGLASNAACHIMRWNTPFHFGHLDGALPAIRRQAQQAIGGQRPDGSWRFTPPPDKAILGEPDSVELGTCAPPAATVWRYARLTGDPVAIAAGRRALAFMDRFVLPAGAQGWECPIHEPDILAAAWAIRAYLDAYQTTGEAAFRDRAVYWARTGLPFCYLWADPAKPGMRYATIPVFGSTFLTHSWLGVPVQWCGLVYAYALQHLAAHDQSLPWARIAQGITVSATIQQFGDEQPELKGCYPDGWYGTFTKRNPPYINPEDIAVCHLAGLGHDPEVSTAIVPVGDARVHVSSGGWIEAARAVGDTVTLRLRRPAGAMTCTMLPFVAAPTAVTIAGRPARRGDDLDAPGVDAAYDPAQATLFLRVEHGAEPVEVSVAGVRPAQPAAPPGRSSWRFDHDVEGWSEDNHCALAARDGTLVCTVSGSDPYCSAPASIDADRQKLLVVRAKLSAGDHLGLFWATESNPGTHPSREVQQPLPADGQWHTVVFDLRQHAGWRGQVTLLRLDVEPPNVPPGTTLAVDWIEARERAE